MTAAKPQKTAGYRSRHGFVVLKIAARLRSFRLDRLGPGVLAFMAKERYFAPPDAENQGCSTIFAWLPLQAPLPASESVVPKKPKALIKLCFSGQTVEVGPNRDASAKFRSFVVQGGDLATQ